MATINLAGIVNESIVDGPGIRTVFFAQGCPRKCEGCHNPETQPFGTGTSYTPDACVCVVKQNILAKGVTFSGGEPFSQAEGFCELAMLLKQDNYEIAAYSGFTFEQLLNGTSAQKQLLQHIDILIDGEFVLAQRNLDLLFKGSENQRVIDVKQSLLEGKAVLSTQSRWTVKKL